MNENYKIAFAFAKSKGFQKVAYLKKHDNGYLYVCDDDTYHSKISVDIGLPVYIFVKDGKADFFPNDLVPSI
jgi:hypothetical protein